MGRIAGARPPSLRTRLRPWIGALGRRVKRLRKRLRPHLRALAKRLRPRLRAWGKRLRPWHRALRPFYLPVAWSLGGLRAAPRPLRIVMIAALAAPVAAAVNLAYQVTQKPTELFFPLSRAFDKMPAETWRTYGDLFREYSTAAIAPELLAALAQAESAGNPVAHTYWRWRWSWRFFDVFAPASSAVGLYQMTDAAFADARIYCVRDHRVVPAASCWHARFYTRILPSHAIELTAINMDRYVNAILAGLPKVKATAQQKQDLAAILNLCGAGLANAYARRGFKMVPGAHCGDHEAAVYVGRVQEMMKAFRKLAAGS
jgi:hypothetical protein